MPPLGEFSGDDKSRLNDVLNHALNMLALKKALQWKMKPPRNLDAYAGEGDNMQQILFNVIEASVRENWTVDLIIAARRQNSGNEELKRLAEDWGIEPGIAGSPPTREAIGGPDTDGIQNQWPMKGKKKKTLRTQAENEIRTSREEHLAIADAEGIHSADNPVPGKIKSSRAEGESVMQRISTLPRAVEYRSTLSRLSSDLSALGNVPAVPQYIAAGAIFQWQLRTLDWLREAERLLEEATDLANARETRRSTSVRLAQATGDAKAGLAWIQDFVAVKGDSPDNNQFPRRCEETIAAISDIIAYAAGM